ncbi:YfdX protein [Nitrosomonas marina]|uniref:YfdX protein n=1 Tax=Nitrosomonas marina TaxID=917 RepID=A0A1I0FBZ4_9PROT|nr:YfdX family protein [Nitrosomonas marina]SET55565.1 YfdX protein [Nitrosomonas marina]
MSKKAFICGSILTLILMQPGTFLAAGSSETAMIGEKLLKQQQPQQSSLALANKMMGHISLAKFAMTIKMPRQTTHQIEKAQILRAILVSQLPEPRIEADFNYGKIDYAKNAQVKEHYVPVVDDVLLISDYEDIFDYLKTLNVQETDAGVVELKVAINLDDIKDALDNALQFIEQEEYDNAQQTLAAAFSSAVIEEKEISDPVLAISENLSLAKAFMNNGQYEKSRFTFKHVQALMNDALEAGIDESVVNKYSGELDALQTALRKKDPSMARSIYDHIDEWIRVVRRH